MAKLGLGVFPVHTVADGLCSCNNPACTSPGKHPLVAGGFKAATTDKAQIDAWWDRLPAANVGVATGAVSGIVVLDVDVGHGGEKSLQALETHIGGFPEQTPAAHTGGGGWHIWMQHPGGLVRCSAGRLGAGLDVRGDGGYVVAPPSTHISGNSYEWVPGHSPWDISLSPIPPRLLDRMRDGSQRQKAKPAAHWREVVKGVPDGGRHEAALQLAGHLLARKVDSIVVADLVLCWNQVRNEPPLADSEVVDILDWVIDKHESGLTYRQRQQDRMRRLGGAR